MQVKEIMTTQIEFAEADETVISAAKMMNDFNIGAIPVKQGDRMIGIITDRDIVTRLLAQGKDPSSTSVREIMTEGLFCCSQDDSIEDAIRTMEDQQVRRLIVCDQEDRPVGILSLGDIATKYGQFELAGEALEMISEPSKPKM